METDNTWPEQDAVEAWWETHRLELVNAVTAYRIKQQNKPRLKRDEFKALLSLIGAVPLAGDASDFITISPFITSEAKRHGFESWSAAYRKLCK